MLVNRKSEPYGTVMTLPDCPDACPDTGPDTGQAPTGRREANRQARREVILDLAEQSFLENGYAGTSMSAIAASLGGSKATLWNYFASKELLFEAVLDRATTQFQARIAQVLAPGGELIDRLHSFARQYLERITSHDAIALYRLVIGEVRRFPETGRIFHERAPERMLRLLSDYIGAAMDAGQLRRADPMNASRQLISLCMSGSHQQLLLGLIARVSRKTIADEADTAVACFLQIYAPA